MLEEVLVGQASDLGSAEAVDLVNATDERERPIERVLDLGVYDGRRRQDAFGLAEFAGDAVLFRAGEVFRDGAGDDAAGEASTFLFEFGDAGARVGDLGFGLGRVGAGTAPPRTQLTRRQMHQQAQRVLFEPHVDVHPVGPDIHIVHSG